MAATATRWRLATDYWLLLRGEEKLRAQGLRRAKAYRVERRAPDPWWAAYARKGKACTAILRRKPPEGLAAAQDHGGLAGRRLRRSRVAAILSRPGLD